METTNYVKDFFKGFYEDMEDYAKKNPPSFTDKFINSIFSPDSDVLKSVLDVMNTESDDNIMSTIEIFYSRIFSIFEYSQNENDRNTAGYIIHHPKFLINLTKILSNKNLDDITVKRINTLYIEYLKTYKPDDKESNKIYSIYEGLAKVVNYRKIFLLEDVVDTNKAIILAASSNSLYNNTMSGDLIANCMTMVLKDVNYEYSMIKIINSICDILFSNRQEMLSYILKPLIEPLTSLNSAITQSSFNKHDFAIVDTIFSKINNSTSNEIYKFMVQLKNTVYDIDLCLDTSWFCQRYHRIYNIYKTLCR